MKRILNFLKAGLHIIPFVLDRHRPSSEFLKFYEPKKILVFGYMGLGDFLMFQPTLKAFRTNYPRAKITLVMGRASSAHLLDNLLDSFSNTKIVDHTNSKEQAAANREIREGEYDLAIIPYTTPVRYFLSCLKSIPVRVGHRRDIKFYSPLTQPFQYVLWLIRFYLFEEELFKRTAANAPVSIDQSSTHEMDKSFSLVLKLKPGTAIERKITFKISDADESAAQNLLTNINLPPNLPLIALHPSASVGQSWKKWPEEKYAELIGKIKSNFRSTILILGTMEEKAQVSNLLKIEGVKSLLGKTSPAQAAALLKKCRLFIGTDSGLGHLAIGVGCPSVRIFGPSDQPGYAVWNSGLHRDIHVDLDCRPCLVSGVPKPGRLNFENCPHMNCLNTLSVDQVFKEIESILK